MRSISAPSVADVSESARKEERDLVSLATLIRTTGSGGIGKSLGWTTQAHEKKASRSLFAEKLPKLSDLGVPAGVGGSRRGDAQGPDGGGCGSSNG